MDERYPAPQFLMRYNYDFLYNLKATLVRYRCLAASKENFVAHTVIEELTLYLIMEESKSFCGRLQTENNGGKMIQSKGWDQGWAAMRSILQGMGLKSAPSIYPAMESATCFPGRKQKIFR